MQISTKTFNTDKNTSTKEVLLFFIPWMIVATLIFSIYIYEKRKEYILVLKTGAAANIKEQSREILSRIENISKDVLSLSKILSIHRYSDKPSTGLAQEVKQEFTSFLTIKKQFDQIRLIDKEGNEKVRVNYNNFYGQYLPVPVPESALQNKSNRYYFIETIKLEMDKLFLSPFDLNMERGRVEQPLKPMLRISTPIHNDEGSINGIIIVNYLADILFESLDTIHDGLPGINMQLNSMGYWINSPDEADRWGFMFEDKKDRIFQKHFPEIWSKISNKDSGQITSSKGIFTYSKVYLTNIKDRSISISTLADANYILTLSYIPSSYISAYTVNVAKNSLPFYIIILAAIALLSKIFEQSSRIKLASDTVVKYLSQALIQSPNVVAITDKDGNLEFVNPKFCEVTQYSEEEAIGQNPRILKSCKTPPETYTELWDTISSGNVWRGEFCNKKKSGDTYWDLASICPIKDEKGKISHYMKVSVDITDYKNIMDNLHRSEKRRAKAQELARMGDWELDIERDVIKASSEFFRLCERPMGDKSISRDSFIEEVVHPDDRAIVRYTMDKAIKDKIKYQTDHRISLPDGTFRIVRAEGQLSIDETNNSKLLMGTLQDITEQRNAESAILEAKKIAEYASRAKSEFLANMSHELRTPLNSIIGFSEMLSAGIPGELNEKQMEFSEDIHASGTHLLNIINDILDLSKIEAEQTDLNISELDIESIVQNSSMFFKEKTTKKEISLIKEIEEGLPHINGDERRVKQVLVNLLSNAMKFTPEGGKITIRAGLDVIGDEGDKIFISVEDTGEGIRKEDINKLFTPFTQLESAYHKKHQGTGLGLALCKKIIELHGGTVGVESTYGKGSCFTIYLPLNKMEASPE